MSFQTPKTAEILYKGGSKQTNPEHNKPVTYLKPTVVKGETENCQLDANTLAQLEAAKSVQSKQEQREKMERFDYLVKMNVSRMS